MDGLTAKVFRTYNASKTLQEQLDSLTAPKANVNEKVLAYNRANRQVAILCNHQRSVPKSFEKSMETLKAKVRDNRRFSLYQSFCFRSMRKKPKLMNSKVNSNERKPNIKVRKIKHRRRRWRQPKRNYNVRKKP